MLGGMGMMNFDLLIWVCAWVDWRWSGVGVYQFNMAGKGRGKIWVWEMNMRGNT